MPRRPRIIIPDIPLHVIQRGNNRQPCFFEDENYRVYLDWIEEYSQLSGCAIHAYVLMTNHVHLLLTPKKKDSAGTFMKRLGQRYVQYINRTYNRSGTMWEGRFRSCIVEQETYLFTCQKYIEMTPVRASMVAYPGDYRWSSFSANALDEPSSLITPHQLYHKLGKTRAERLAVYQEQFKQELNNKTIRDIRKATNGNFSLGRELSQVSIGNKLKRRVTKGKPGRPAKKSNRSS